MRCGTVSVHRSFCLFSHCGKLLVCYIFLLDKNHLLISLNFPGGFVSMKIGKTQDGRLAAAGMRILLSRMYGPIAPQIHGSTGDIGMRFTAVQGYC